MVKSAMDEDSDRGELLFKELWPEGKKFMGEMAPLWGLFLLFGAILMLAIIIDSFLAGSEKFADICFFFGFASLLFLWWSYMVFLRYLSRMPLIIYEKGFDLIHVPIYKGIIRRESFISWNRLENVTVDEYTEKITMVHRLRLRINYGGLKKEKITSRDMGLQEVQNALEFFKRYIPGKVHDLRSSK